MKEYTIYPPSNGNYMPIPIYVKADKLVVEDSGQKVFYIVGGEVVAVAAPEATVINQQYQYRV